MMRVACSVRARRQQRLGQLLAPGDLGRIERHQPLEIGERRRRLRQRTAVEPGDLAQQAAPLAVVRRGVQLEVEDVRQPLVVLGVPRELLQRLQRRAMARVGVDRAQQRRFDLGRLGLLASGGWWRCGSESRRSPRARARSPPPARAPRRRRPSARSARGPAPATAAPRRCRAPPPAPSPAPRRRSPVNRGPSPRRWRSPPAARAPTACARPPPRCRRACRARRRDRTSARRRARSARARDSRSRCPDRRRAAGAGTRPPDRRRRASARRCAPASASTAT